jgi:hypothetical protein
MALQLIRRRFTAEEYHRMVEAGILAEDDRLELIEGEILEMSPIGRHHAAMVNRRPSGHGVSRVVRCGEQIAAIAFPDRMLAVGQILGE